MRRELVSCTVLLLCVAAAAPGSAAEGAKGTILCSTTQIADFARNIVGDRRKVDCILAPGQDPHMYQITPNDAKRVRESDLCFDNGLHLEGGDWMRTVAVQEGRPIVSCTQGMEPLMIQQNGESVPVPDPHAWFSVKNAAHYVRVIQATLAERDPDYRHEYTARATLYLDQLRSLDAWIVRQLNAVPSRMRILVTSHDAFNYFCHEYGLKATAPVGWSTQEVGAEVTPRRRARVIASIRESGVQCVFIETSVNPKLIRQIAEEAGVRIGGTLYSDSMGPPGSAGESYVGMMRENVLTILEGLTAER